MRIAAVSDLHGQLPPIPPCDLLLIAGDLCPLSDHADDAQRAFLEGPFSDWLVRAPARAIAGIAGNHDLIAEREPALLAGLPWSYLCDSEADLVGLRIWGSPFAVTYGEWAFMESDGELERRFAAIPVGLDVLLVHGPPHGILDHALRGVDTGSRALRRAIVRARPSLAVFGHIHEGRGEVRLGATRCLSVSLVDARYVPRHAPVEIELAPRPRLTS
jgi:3',5'-cyclic AMP phosphodiesterase CpdA